MRSECTNATVLSSSLTEVFEHQPAVVDDRDMVHDVLDVPDLMRGQDYGPFRMGIL